MPPTPSFSVVIPAYKSQNYIEKCILSVLSQTVRDVEVLVVDDASPDDTRGVIARLAQRDNRIKPIYLERNGGVCNARNAALDAAQGTWVAVLDSDDWIAPARLERMRACAEDLGADVVIDDQFFIREGDAAPCARMFLREPAGGSPLDPAHLVARDRPEHMGYGLAKPLFRRTFLEDHNIRYRLGTERFEDFLFLIDCLARGARSALLNEPLYYYLLRAGSLTGMDQIRTMDGLSRQNDTALEIARDAGATGLEAALMHRAALIGRGRRYYQVITPIKRKDYGAAVRALAMDPLIVPYLGEKFAVRLIHRLGRRDPLELALLPGAKLAAGT